MSSETCWEEGLAGIRIIITDSWRREARWVSVGGRPGKSQGVEGVQRNLLGGEGAGTIVRLSLGPTAGMPS